MAAEAARERLRKAKPCANGRPQKAGFSVINKITQRQNRRRRNLFLLASTALVAPLILAQPVFAGQGNPGGGGGSASAGINAGGGGGAGASADGVAVGTNGGNGSNGGGGTLGGGGGISDWGGGGGQGNGRGAGGGGGGAGGTGLTISTSVTKTISETTAGGNGGNGGNGSAVGSGTNGGRGGGGGGGGGASGIYVTSVGTSATINVNAGVTVQGGNGGNGGDAVGTFSNSFATSDGGVGGNGGHGITVNSMTTQVTINNSGTVSGGVGGGGGYGTTGVHNSGGQRGSGILGSNVAITNNATGIIKPGDGAVPIDSTNVNGINNAISITGGTNSIVNKGQINGRIELYGASTTTVSGTYSNALKINGLSTMKIEGSTAAGDATGFTTIQNNGAIDIAAGRTLGTQSIGIGTGGSVKIGAGATLSSNDSNLYNNGTIDVATNGTLSNTGSFDNYNGIINFNGANAKLTVSGVTNWGQMNVTAGKATVTGDIDNSNGGKISLTGGDMSGISTLNNGTGGSVQVDAGRTLSVKTFTSTAGSTSGAGTINAEDAINLSAGTYGTTFSGTGALTKSGSGTVILTAENTYSGGTTIEAGTLQIGDGGTSGSITGNVTNNGTLAFNRSDNVTFSGSVAGTGKLTKSGAGTLTLTGTNSYFGGTTISAGTLEIGNGGTLGSLDSNVANSGTLAFNRSDNVDFGGIVSGTGDLVKKGAGTLTLYGANTYSGDTKIQSGTLKLGTGGSLAAATDVDVGAGTVFDINGHTQTVGQITGTGEIKLGASGALTSQFDSVTAVFGGAMTGGGSLTKAGTGTMVLTGTNTYTGGTTISGGTLSIGNGGATGSLAGNITNNAALVFNRAGYLVYDGDISGTGTLTKDGTGTLVLTGSNSHTGLTTVNSGILQIGNGGETGSLTGDVLNKSTLVFNRSNDLTYAGSISGAGTLTKDGDGTLTLTGANLYTGATQINHGTLKLGTGGSLASSTDVFVYQDGVFDINNHAQTVGQISGAGEIKLGDTGALTSQFDRNTAIFAGAITGGGSLTKAGTGTMVLTGTSTYTGGTTISGGVLQIGDGGTSGSIAGNVTNDGMLVFYRSDELTFGGDVSGTGKLAKHGDGTLILTGENTYSGGTTIYTGTLQIGNGGTSGSITGDIGNGGTLAFNRSDDTTFDGVITGTGNVVKLGQGTLTFTGANYYKGETQIKEGTLQIGNGGTTGQITDDIVNAGKLVFNRSDDIGYGATISGTGSLVKDGAGTLTVWGDLTHTGGTTIKRGTLQIGDGGVHGSIAGDVVNDGTLAFNRYDLTFDGDMSGSGALVQKGPGVLTYTGTATHTGGTKIQSGTLQIGNGGTAGSIAGDIVNDSTLVFNRSDDIGFGDDISGAGSVVKDGVGKLTLTGENTYSGGTTIKNGILQVGDGDRTGSITGNVANDGTLAFNRLDDITFGGVVSGTGALVKQGAGTLTLTGASTYSGDTTIEKGTLKLGTGGSLAASTDVAVAAGAVFDLNGHAQTVEGLSGAGEIKLGADGELTVEAEMKQSTFAGSITGDGSLVKKGKFSRLILTGDNTYTGGTTVDEGILQIGSGLTGSITSDIVNNGLVFFARNNDLTYGGDISGTGEVRKEGVGTLTLTGTFSHKGGTTVSSGTFEIGNGGTSGAILGDITNDATLAFNRSDDITFADVISGRGALIKKGAGTLILTGENSYEGGTTIKTGTLQVGDGGRTGSITGDVANDGTLAFKRADDVEFDGAISGSGKLVKDGDGLLTLGGTNTFTGGTTIEKGTLQVGDGKTSGSLSGDIVNKSKLVFDRSDDVTFAGVISGAGALTKNGDGVLTLSGVNLYTGNTVIAEGTLKGTAANFSTSKIVNDAKLVIDQATDADFANVIEGDGAFTKSGAGNLNLTGISGFNGATTVAQGRLAVNGSLASSTVTVEQGATLGGTGTVGGVVVKNGGTLGAGNSIGEFRVDGDLEFKSGSTFGVEVDNEGKGDKVTVTGKATLAGQVDVKAGEGKYKRRTNYTILTADEIENQFSGVTSNFAFLKASLSYDAHDVNLILERNTISFDSIARTRNQVATGGGLEKLGDGNSLFDALLDLDENAARKAFDQLSGELHASLSGMLIADSRFLRDAAAERLRMLGGGPASDTMGLMALGATDARSAGAGDGISLWGTALGSWSKVKSDGNAAAFDRTLGGFIGGADLSADDHWRLGVLGGYSTTSFDASDRDASGDADGYHLGLYAGGQWGGFGLRAGATYSLNEISTKRRVSFGNLSEHIDADYAADTAQIFGEVAYRFGGDDLNIEPFAGLSYVNLDSDGFHEDGGAAALKVKGSTKDVTFSTLGLRGTSRFDLGEAALGVRGMAGWRHAEGDVTPTADVAFGNGEAFTIAGAPIEKDTAVFEAGIDLDFGAGTTLGLTYSGEIGKDVEQHGGQASFLVKF